MKHQYLSRLHQSPIELGRSKFGDDEDEVADDGDDIDNDNSLEDGGHDAGENGQVEEDEFEKETADEKRLRMAKAHLEKIREMAKRENEDKDEDEDGERHGMRDSLVSRLMQQEQLEESDRSRRRIASGVQKPETGDDFRVLIKHHQSVTTVALSDDDLKGFSASKDGTILHWDVNSGKGERYQWPSDEILKYHGVKDPQGRASKQTKHTLALASSFDSRYLATGGLDCHIHLWDTRTREHI